MTSEVSLSLLSCWAALLASICACLLSRLPTRKERGKCYLKRMLATPSEYVTCSFVCPVSFSASVEPHFALFNCFSSCCLASRSRLLWSLTSLSSALAWCSHSRLLWSLTSLSSAVSRALACHSRSRLL